MVAGPALQERKQTRDGKPDTRSDYFQIIFSLKAETLAFANILSHIQAIS